MPPFRASGRGQKTTERAKGKKRGNGKKKVRSGGQTRPQGGSLLVRRRASERGMNGSEGGGVFTHR